MDDADTIKAVLSGYQAGQDISQDELLVDMSLEYDEEKDQYLLKYGVKVAETESITVERTFRYDTFREAWDNYLDQLPELDYSFPNANLLMPEPGNFDAAKGGGNPFVRVKFE